MVIKMVNLFDSFFYTFFSNLILISSLLYFIFIFSFFFNLVYIPFFLMSQIVLLSEKYNFQKKMIIELYCIVLFI